MSNIVEFEASLKAQKGLQVNSTIRKHNLRIDEPKELGGTDQGPNPVEIVLAALGACQQIVIKFYAEKLGVQIDSVDTHAKGDLDTGGFLGTSKVRPGFQNITAVTNIKASGDPKQVAELLRIAEERCPVLDILRNGVPVKATIRVQ